MKSHANIPVFIPHLGCPNQCVFCNQRTISGVTEFKAESVRDIIDSALLTLNGVKEVEIAFFGGSFTGIDRSLMISLLEIANEYIDSGRVQSIRCSTRPDYIDKEIIGILKKYRVNTVELGLQSVSDEVLLLTKRGHGSSDEAHACKLITDAGISLVGQMMIGLPGSTLETELETARFIINAGAKAARIYPTVVFHETELAEMARAGIYQPIALNEAVERSGAVFEELYSAGVEVIRIGLCSSENLFSDKTYFTGPNHAALGELVLGEFFLRRIRKELLSRNISGKTVEINVAPSSLSKAVGQKKINKEKLSAEFSSRIIFKGNDELSDYDFFVKVVEAKERKKRCT